MDSSSISVAVIGKTGAGKSYFSNLILNNQKPKQGLFQVYDSLESGTQQPQVEMNQKIEYGNKQITLNIIDTPSFFDTNDHPTQQEIPQSITHLKNIFQTLQNFQLQLNKVILIFSCGQRFDVHHKGMIDMSMALFAEPPNLCVVLTKCQNLYDQEIDDEDEIINKLNNCQKQWQSQLALYGISEIYYISGQPISRYQNKNDVLSQFYYKQWSSLYDLLKESKQFKLNSWEHQSQESKMMIQQYFNFQIPPQSQVEDQNNSVNDHLNEQHNNQGCLSLDVLINGIDYDIRVDEKFQAKKFQILGSNTPDTSLGLIHYSKTEQCRFLQIKYKYVEGQVELEALIDITGDHLIYCCNYSQFIKAKYLKINDFLVYKNGINKQNVQITAITQVIKYGYFSPLTISGTFYGNGILLSCYVSPDQFSVTQDIAHVAMQPLILFRQLKMSFQYEASDQQIQRKKYKAPYAKALEWIFC